MGLFSCFGLRTKSYNAKKYELSADKKSKDPKKKNRRSTDNIGVADTNAYPELIEETGGEVHSIKDIKEVDENQCQNNNCHDQCHTTDDHKNQEDQKVGDNKDKATEGHKMDDTNQQSATEDKHHSGEDNHPNESHTEHTSADHNHSATDHHVSSDVSHHHTSETTATSHTTSDFSTSDHGGHSGGDSGGGDCGGGGDSGGGDGGGSGD